MERKEKRQILYIISIVLLLVFGFLVRSKDTGILLDNKILDVFSNIESKGVDKFFRGITVLASAKFIIPIGFLITAYFVYKMERRKGWLVLISFAGSYSINAVLKVLFKRVRPIAYMRYIKEGYSFPSGHAMVGMSFYMVLGYLLAQEIKDVRLKKTIRIISIVLPIIISVSRIYLGVHWPSDVIVGALLGASISSFISEDLDIYFLKKDS